MLQNIQKDQVNLIVVHKMDRFSRSLQGAVQALEQLGKYNVELVSISEPNLDYSSPQGKLFMHMLSALAQFYSDNLSQETKKGKNERKLQGLYNGHLPFGVIKGEDCLPIPDKNDLGEGKTNYKGLLKIYQLAAEGNSCREIAESLNFDGYRTMGNRGHNLFTRESINEIIKNRFYLGELPDGEYKRGRSSRGIYTKNLPGKHQMFVPIELWERAHQARNLTRYRTVTSSATTYSLSGLIKCHYCGGRLHIHRDRKGIPFIYCYKKGRSVAKRFKQTRTHLSVFENQLEIFLSKLTLPPYYQLLAISDYEKEGSEEQEFERTKHTLQTRLVRLRALYEWGDLTQEEYKIKRDQIKDELAVLPVSTVNYRTILEKLTTYLKKLDFAWKEATQEQRNRIAKTLFEVIEIEDKKIKRKVFKAEFSSLYDPTHS